MTGIIDVGGGLRGIYGAGVFDRCLDDNISFDYCIGVSAGSANVASFTAGQRGRNYRFYNEYSFHKEYMGLDCLRNSGSFIGLDYVYSVLSNSGGLDPLNYSNMKDYCGEIKTVATNALTGLPEYFDKSNYRQNDYSVLKASSCLPIVCRPIVINEIPYFDGGISDPVPIEKAFADGCNKVVVILTKPIDAKPAAARNKAAADLIGRHYPEAAKAMQNMAQKYLYGVEIAKKYAECGKALIIAPADCCGVKTLTRNRSKLDKLYRMGYNDAEKIGEFVKKI